MDLVTNTNEWRPDAILVLLHSEGRATDAAIVELAVGLVPSSLSQPVGRALGAQAGEARIRKVASEPGFMRFRRATETGFNIVHEAKA